MAVILVLETRDGSIPGAHLLASLVNCGFWGQGEDPVFKKWDGE